jgi:putative effector of murein hydrolase LrgA (UPF0299 family)
MYEASTWLLAEMAIIQVIVSANIIHKYDQKEREKMETVLAVLFVIGCFTTLICTALTLAFVADVLHERFFMSPERRRYEEGERAFAIWAKNKNRRLK